MNCSHCQRPVHRGPCGPAQKPLLPPPPVWRRELQQRVEAYRARQAAAGLHPNATPPEPANVVSFPSRLQQQAAAEEPLAEPVVPAPRPREATDGATVRVLPPPPRTWPRPTAARPETESELGLAEAVRAALPRERTLLAASSSPAPSAAFLQIPLPMAPEPAAAATAVQPAERRMRLRAGLVDAGVVLTGALLFALAGWASLDFAPLPAHGLRSLLPAVAAVPLVLAALYLGLSALAGGVTPGMRRCGLRVESLEGPLTRQALRRRGWASLMSLGALGLGFVWMYCDAQGLTWHDSISGTCVVGPGAEQEKD